MTDRLILLTKNYLELIFEADMCRFLSFALEKVGYFQLNVENT